MLVRLAGTCRSLRFQLRDTQPFLDGLSGEHGPVADLLAAVSVALGSTDHAEPGTPADLERKALAALHDLADDRRRE